LYFDIDFNLQKSQKVLLTPQVKQAYDILRMSSQELFDYLEKQLQDNPALDICEKGRDTYKTPKEFVKEFNDDSTDEINDNFARYSQPRISLKEYLLFQLYASKLNKDFIPIAEYLIDSVDENGYLTVNLPEVAEFFNAPLQKVNFTLEFLQTFDPPGICARNLKECLLIQLRQTDAFDVDTAKVIECHLDDLAGGKLEKVSENTGFDIEKIKEIYDFIRTLEPKPGREFYSFDHVKYVVPDIIIRKNKLKYEVLINEEALPVVSINRYYKRMINRNISRYTRNYILSSMNKALWVIQCIEQRKEILKRVAEYIVDKRYDFFDKGEKYFELINIDEISDALSVHSSLIQRAIENKYIQCKWGVFELRYFFN